MLDATPSTLNFPVHLTHFSDIHLTTRPLGWRFEDFWNKRLSGWFNLKLGRGRRFQFASRVIDSLMREIRDRRPDHLIFSGDATMLGFDAELAKAVDLLGISQHLPPGLAVPGNHDYYVAGAERRGGFERRFAAWQKGERIDEHIYPFAQRVGPVWLIGVNSACANRWSIDARGQVGAAQLARLEKLLDRLGEGLRILVTHYPLALAKGGHERPWRRLRDWQKLERVAEAGQVRLWLHGHRHSAYCHPPNANRSFGQICVGSTTLLDHWSYHEYVVEENRVTIHRRQWSPDTGEFNEVEQQEMDLLARKISSDSGPVAPRS